MWETSVDSREKFCCFRFDVDTHVCVTRGMPRLLDLARELDVQFTFFVNMGRAFDRRLAARKAFRRVFGKKKAVTALSAAAKLGLMDAAYAAIFNPKAGQCGRTILQRACAEGHEIGMHGGRNHAQWERSAGEWTDSKVASEVSASLKAFEDMGLDKPVSFASPAWNSPPSLRQLLPSVGIPILADTYDATAQAPVHTAGGLTLFPTNITYGPGNAGYLECAHLHGLSRQEVVADFAAQLEAKPRLAVVYDHPFFSALHELETLRALVLAALQRGFQCRAIKDTVRAMSEMSEPSLT